MPRAAKIAAALLALTLTTIGLAPGSAPRAAVRAASPRCASRTLDASAQPAGTALTVSPAPGERAAPAQTTISLLGAPPAAIAALSVLGSRSGRHTGRLLGFSQGDGSAFLPNQPFLPGEAVSVALRLASSPAISHWQFTVAESPLLTPVPAPKPTVPPVEPVQSFHSRPDLLPPQVAVAGRSHATAPGLLFMAPYSGPGQSGPMIFDDTGALVWFAPMGDRGQAADFRVQTYDGRPALTWWQDPLDASGHRVYEDVIFDSSYRQIAAIRAGNGLVADHHEFELGPRDTALIVAYDAVRCDLSAYGGPRDGSVWDGIVQDIDIPTGLVRFEWHALDHVAMNESYASAKPSRPGVPYDPFHLNSVNPNRDGSLMISARHTWAVYDVDPATGQVRWRLGGRRNSFRESRAAQMAWQHDARQLAGPYISVFDNGAVPAVHRQSRGLVIRLDVAGRRASFVRQFEHPERLLAGSQGNLQQLPDGHWIVGWGQVARLSEFSPAGRLLFDAHLPAIEQSYRAFRLPWQGTPSYPPALAAVHQGAHGLSVYASWNGATDVAGWEVLEGATVASLTPVARSARTGFETRIDVGRAPVVAVSALDAGGRVMATSGAVSGA